MASIAVTAATSTAGVVVSPVVVVFVLFFLSHMFPLPCHADIDVARGQELMSKQAKLLLTEAVLIINKQ